jgi:nucleoside-diphosphate-sugar epimerase
VTAFSKHPRIKQINVDASLSFVETLTKRAKVRRFINVGTAWCVGMGCPQIVPETAEVQDGEHLVPYTDSKIEFERRVRAEYPEFPFVSARPSIVVGHTRFGTDPSGSIYWVFRSAQLLGKFTCALDDRIDVVPVDWVAKALIDLAVKDELAFDTYHLSAGTAYASTIEQLDVAIAKGLNVAPHGAGYRRVDDEDLVRAIYAVKGKLGDARPRLLAHALTLYGKFASSGVVFDNARTLAEGIAPPPPFYTYADRCAESAEKSSLAEQMFQDFK